MLLLHRLQKRQRAPDFHVTSSFSCSEAAFYFLNKFFSSLWTAVKYSVLIHAPVVDVTKHVHTVHAVDVLDTLFTCLQTAPKTTYSLNKKKSLKISFALNPSYIIPFLVQSILTQAIKYSIKMDPSSNNMESSKVIANIWVLSLHQSHNGALIPPSFISNSGTCNHGNIHWNLSSRTELTITITAQNTWGGEKRGEAQAGSCWN